MNPSYWETTQWSHFDVVIIGGGIIGINAALSLQQLQPSWRIGVLERGLLPTGASTRNAGFACFGSASELWADGLNTQTIERRWQGLHLLRERCGDDAVEFVQGGGHELFTADHECLHNLEQINEALRNSFGTEVYRNNNELLSHYGFGKGAVACVSTALEGTLNSGKYLRKLWQLARAADIEVFTGTNVDRVVPNARGGNTQIVCTTQMQTMVLDATVVLQATNAWGVNVEGVQEREQFVPARGQIMVTEPVADLDLQGCFHMLEGFYYFRMVEGRILFGGGRQTAFEAEETFNMETSEHIQNHLEELLHSIVYPKRKLHIEHRWAGIMGFSRRKEPVIQQIAPGVVQAMGCNGMGVAIGCSVATEAANKVMFVYGNSETR